MSLGLDQVRVRALRPSDTTLLQQFVAKEAVLPVRGPRDLERRLAPDRRVLSVEDDRGPLCFVQVALTHRPVDTLEGVLGGPQCPGPRTVATFYGITRVSERARGHAGALLHHTVGAVRRENPAVETCATLSPMPGFRGWVEAVLDDAAASARLDAVARQVGAGIGAPGAVPALERLALGYLAARDHKDRVRDPVGRFHLGNGAAVRAVLVGADGSWHGLERSFGVMVSYRYTPADAPGLTPAPLPPDAVRGLVGMLDVAGSAA